MNDRSSIPSEGLALGGAEVWSRKATSDGEALCFQQIGFEARTPIETYRGHVHHLELNCARNCREIEVTTLISGLPSMTPTM